MKHLHTDGEANVVPDVRIVHVLIEQPEELVHIHALVVSPPPLLLLQGTLPFLMIEGLGMDRGFTWNPCKSLRRG